jgi:hypothetical protein
MPRSSRLSAARRGQIPGLLEIQIPLLMGRKNPTQPSFAKIVSKTFGVSGICGMNCRADSGIAAE